MQIIVKLTNQCNLHCSYCSEGDTKETVFLDEKLIQKMVNELPALLRHCATDHVSILWHGGEPLLYGKGRLCRVMDYAKKKLSDFKLSFAMQTNGYAIDDQWIEIFKKYDIGVGISIDGYRELHDLNRVTDEGKGSFDKVLANYQKMESSGLSAGVLMVLDTDKEINLEKLYSFIEDNGISIKIHPVIPCGRASGKSNVAEINDNYLNLLKCLFERCMASDSISVVEPLNHLLDAILADNDSGECAYSGKCAIDFICLYSDGAVGVCGRRIKDGKFEYGLLHNSSLLNLYNSELAYRIRARQEFLKENDCAQCNYWQWCHGGCTFEAVNSVGIVNAKVTCEFRRKLVDYMMTTGVDLLKARLLRDKMVLRKIIKSKKVLIKEIENA